MRIRRHGPEASIVPELALEREWLAAVLDPDVQIWVADGSVVVPSSMVDEIVRWAKLAAFRVEEI